MPLSSEIYQRYERQMILPEFGEEGQLKLQQAKVLVVGAGGLGCPVLLYLAAVGVGAIGVADDDVVSLNNLHRQVLYGTDDIGKLKVDVAQEKLLMQNSNTQIETYSEKITSQNAIDIISQYDIVVDGTDNFQAKYLLNDACVIAGKVLVYGSILRYEGQVAVFNHNSRINYRDIFPEPPQNIPNCAEAGVIGSLCGIIGSMQANEVIKIILGKGESLDGKLLCYDGLNNDIQVFQLKKDPANPEIKNLIDYDLFCGAPPPIAREIDAAELKRMIEEQQDFQLIDVREQWEKDESDIGGERIALKDILAQSEQISKDKKVVMYCKTGLRSLQALLLLHNKGFRNLYNLHGGIQHFLKVKE